jgi:hypothetical protein
MHPYPHIYIATAAGKARGTVELTAEGLPPVVTTPPPQFDGPEATGRRKRCYAPPSPIASS